MLSTPLSLLFSMLNKIIFALLFCFTLWLIFTSQAPLKVFKVHPNCTAVPSILTWTIQCQGLTMSSARGRFSHDFLLLTLHMLWFFSAFLISPHCWVIVHLQCTLTSAYCRDRMEVLWDPAGLFHSSTLFPLLSQSLNISVLMVFRMLAVQFPITGWWNLYILNLLL